MTASAVTACPVDVYPTRLAPAGTLPEPIPRREPVVWGDAAAVAAAAGIADAAERFASDGFLALPGFFTADEANAWRNEARRLARHCLDHRPQEAFFERDGGALRSLFAVHAVSTPFAALARDARLVDLARALLDDDVYLHQSRLNFKPAHRGSGFYWHSDFETWHAEDGMPRMRAASFSIALSRNDPFNGPVMLIPGSHRSFVPCAGETPPEHYRRSLVAQEVGTPAAASLSRLMEHGGLEMPVGPPGSLLVFDCNTMHGSYENLSGEPRINLFFVYNARSNALEAPFAAPAPRPEFVATRNAT